LPKLPTSSALLNSPKFDGAYGQAPGRIQRPLRREAPHKIAAQIEDIDESIPVARHIVVLVGILFGVG